LPEIKRINVAVNPETVQALQLIVDREGVNLAEAVRRLVGYGDLMYRTIRVDEDRMVILGKGGDREVQLA
jgi:hypothetical protein